MARALAAGAAGTAAMTVYQTAVAKLRGTEASTTLAEVGKRVIRGVFHRRFDEDQTPLLKQCDALGLRDRLGYRVRAHGGCRPAGHPPGTQLRDAGVWGASLRELPAMKLAPPVWDYPPGELVLDVSYHLVYGVAVAAAYRALNS